MKLKTAHTNTILLEKRKFGQNCHSLSLLVIGCHRLSLFVTRCTTCCHSLSLVSVIVPLVVTRCPRCHSLSLVVPLVVTCCTTRSHSLYRSLSFVVTRCTTRCHSSLDVPLVCLFKNDHLGVLCKRFSSTFHKYQRKAPSLESLFSNVSGFMPATLLKRDFKTVLGKFSQENSHPENSHPSNTRLENPTPPENSHPENSHLEYSHPFH